MPQADNDSLTTNMPKPDFIENRNRYHVFADVTTRWNDNDDYGHVNNAVYNTWMDTAVTEYFRAYWPKLPNTSVIPVAAETKMIFHRAITHPEQIQTGFRVEQIGRSSVRCGVGIFVREEVTAAAWGHMVHVWVDRQTNKAVEIPDDVRNGLHLALTPDT